MPFRNECMLYGDTIYLKGHYVTTPFTAAQICEVRDARRSGCKAAMTDDAL